LLSIVFSGLQDGRPLVAALLVRLRLEDDDDVRFDRNGGSLARLLVNFISNIVT
jgi:hypothetical protein